MSYEKKLTVDVRTIGDFDETPSKAVIIIDGALRDRIKQLQRAVKDLKAAYIEDYDYTPTFMVRDENDELVEWEGDMNHADCERLVVTDKEYWWQALVKHTDISIETEAQKVSDL